MAEEQEIPQEEPEVEADDSTKLPFDAQLASDIFTRENIDGILERGVGTFHALDSVRRIVRNIPSSCTPRDLLFLIESLGTEGDFNEENFITFFVECLGIVTHEFVPTEDDAPEEEFPLTADFIADRLSDLQPVEGAEFTFNFASFVVTAADITAVDAIVGFNSLLDISLKQNQILDIAPFAELPRLKTLDLTENKVRTLAGLKFPKLEVLILAKNQLSALELFEAPNLKKIDLSGNKIFYIGPFTFVGTPKLETLIVSQNGIRTFREDCFFGLKSLKTLKLQENGFQSILSAMHPDLAQLNDIDISDNQVTTLYGFGYLEALEVLDVHKTLLDEPLVFSPLLHNPKLKYLYIYETPLADFENARLELIHLFPLLEEIDETAVSVTERQDSQQMIEEREAEARRLLEEQLALEAEAAAAAAAAAAAEEEEEAAVPEDGQAEEGETNK
jgi:hypothetical protein